MIDPYLHQIWVGTNKLPKREDEFSLQIEKESMKMGVLYNLWTDFDTSGFMYRATADFRMQYNKFYREKNYAFCADILRWMTVYESGGMYLDIDFEFRKSIKEFYDNDGVLFYHPNPVENDFTIVNGAFGFKRKHPLLEHCIQQIKADGFWYGPEFFGRAIKSYYNLPYETPHEILKERLKEDKILYFDWEIFHRDYAQHHALYSWSDRYTPEKS